MLVLHDRLFIIWQLLGAPVLLDILDMLGIRNLWAPLDLLDLLELLDQLGRL